MDSLTQIALGAAVGELLLGRKIGNKAMFWGAVGGTIPDLDVLANPFLSEAASVKFHRGPTHSIFFAAVFSVLMAWIMEKYYSSYLFHSKNWRKFWRIIFTAIPILLLVLILGIGWSGISFFSGAIALVILGLLAFSVWQRTPVQPQDIEKPSFLNWYWFFFWVFVSHILLDIFTTYGTQMLWPFTDYPFQLDTISIVDPLYTIPLVVFGFVASLYHRSSDRRKFFNRLALILSTFYLLLTVANKVHMDSVFRESLEDKGLEYLQIKTTPTLFNNLLWFGIAELEDEYIIGYYSLLDSEREFSDWHREEKNHDLIRNFKHDRDVEILVWFSRGFYKVQKSEEGYQFTDLRFGNIDFTGTNQDAGGPFFFLLKKDSESGEINISRNRPEIEGDFGKIWRTFWQRVGGR
ncbi:MAG: metal-dependent hydrolase [Saprospirales bacterium]|nr:MAG: metal-dependent hydrolase [Saprospirales bacterium]